MSPEVAAMDASQFKSHLQELRDAWVQSRVPVVMANIDKLQVELTWLRNGGVEKKGIPSPLRHSVVRATHSGASTLSYGEKPDKPKQLGHWMLASEYAKKEGVVNQSIYKRIARGHLKTKLISGRRAVWVDGLPDRVFKSKQERLLLGVSDGKKFRPADAMLIAGLTQGGAHQMLSRLVGEKKLVRVRPGLYRYRVAGPKR